MIKGILKVLQSVLWLQGFVVSDVQYWSLYIT